MEKAGLPVEWTAEIRRELEKSIAGTSGGSLSLRNLLSSRELEICALVADGLSSKEIACRLGLAAATVERHRHNARRKLGLPARQGSLGALQLGSDL
jgi:DNA-binding CsgD family transcriptional regulator